MAIATAAAPSRRPSSTHASSAIDTKNTIEFIAWPLGKL